MPSGRTINKQVVRAVLVDPNTFATTIVVILVDFYGTEVFSWAPETIRLETEEDLDFVWPQANYDRLMAGVALIISNSFYKSLPDFIELCGILSGAPAHPGVFQPADPAECAWGITEALLLSPPDDEEPFSEEIRAYIGKVCEMEGITNLPDILKIGTQEKDLKHKINNNFGDDPEMYNAIWQVEAEKTDDINDLVKGRLGLLISQLSALQLINGNTGDIAKRMSQNLHSKPKGGSPL